MKSDEIAYLSAIDLIDQYRSRHLSPVEVTMALIDRMATVEPIINAFITMTPELALAQAKRAELDYQNGSAGALAGVPLTIKDLSLTSGVRTTRGSLLYEHFVPDVDTPVVERLLDAGAVMLGKTSTPEFGWKGETTNQLSGSSHNPWQYGKTPGGSSGGGAAAVAAGIGPMAQGSDGAGSIRIPCAFCGIYGLKPSYGLVPFFPAGAVGDLSHAGPMTRTVRDAALFLNVVAGADDRDRYSWSSGIDYLTPATSPEIHGLRIAWSGDLGYAAIDREVSALFTAAVREFTRLGAEVVEAHPDLSDPWPIVDTIWCAGMAAGHRDNLAEVRHQLDPGRLVLVERGVSISAVELISAQTQRNAYSEGWRQFMQSYHLFLSPTLPITAFDVGLDYPALINDQPMTYLGWTPFTYPFNLTGQPAATVPIGFTSTGLPVGLQIVGRWHDDATVIRASAAFERARPWDRIRPSLGTG